MPKLINHQERKQHIALAVWAVLAREGVRGISVRTVAEEAGISTGSLRHVFPTLNDMMLYSLDYSGQRFLASLTSRKVTGPLIDHFEDLLFDFLPTSNESRMYSEVVVGMLAEASNIPGAARMLQQLRVTYHDMFAWLERAGELTPGTDPVAQADQLLILGQGITAKTILDGQRSEPVDLSRAFRTHLNKVLVHPVPYLTEEEITELTKELARYRSTSSSSAH